jgi:hypothetical protein
MTSLENWQICKSANHKIWKVFAVFVPLREIPLRAGRTAPITVPERRGKLQADTGEIAGISSTLLLIEGKKDCSRICILDVSHRRAISLYER